MMGGPGLSLGKRRADMKWSTLPLYEKLWHTAKNSGKKVENVVYYAFVPFFLYLCVNADNQVKSQPMVAKLLMILQSVIPIGIPSGM